MKIVIGNDHAACEMKFELVSYLQEKGCEMINVGTDTPDRVNYPEYAEKVAQKVVSGEADCGIILCGTGIGVAIAANKVHGIRAAVCNDPVSARLAKEHNHANIITMGARIIGPEMAKGVVDAYLNAECLGGRHQMRVDMIMEMEKGTDGESEDFVV